MIQPRLFLGGNSPLQPFPDGPDAVAAQIVLAVVPVAALGPQVKAQSRSQRHALHEGAGLRVGNTQLVQRVLIDHQRPVQQRRVHVEHQLVDVDFHADEPALRLVALPGGHVRLRPQIGLCLRADAGRKPYVLRAVLVQQLHTLGPVQIGDIHHVAVVVLGLPRLAEGSHIDLNQFFKG